MKIIIQATGLLLILALLFLGVSCQPMTTNQPYSQAGRSDPSAPPAKQSLQAPAKTKGTNPPSVSGAQSPRASGPESEPKISQKDINQDLTQPLEQEVTTLPPPTESFALSNLDRVAREALESEPEISFELDITETQTLQYYFQYYTQKHRATFQRWLKRAEPYLPYIRRVFTERGLPQDLVFLPFAESGFNPWAYSRAGAAGLWQFIPSTARMFDLRVDWWIDERRDPYLATQAAATFLNDLHQRFEDWHLALAAYNCGAGRVSRALKKTDGSSFFDISQSKRYLARETRNYIPKFLAVLKIVRNLESLGFEPINWDAPERPHQLEVKGGTDLLALTRHLELDWDRFRQANPAFKRMASPPDQSSPVYLKPDLLAAATAFLKTPDASPYAGFHRYKVQNGDSWWKLSRRFHTPVQVLKKTNRTRSDFLRAGAWILIPGAQRTILASRSAPGFSASPRTYRVRQGESLWSIAHRFGLSVDRLRRANTLLNRDTTLQIGQELRIPGLNQQQQKQVRAAKRSNYTIQKGDTLWALSRRFGTSLKTLQAANGLPDNALLQVGTRIYIPDLTPGQTRQARERSRSSHKKIIEYYVRKGDNLWSISNDFDISLATLIAANDLAKGDLLHIGKQLSIPVSSPPAPAAEPGSADEHQQIIFYTIKTGDSLWSIARRFGVSLDQLRDWNDLDPGLVLHPGDTLKILIS